jgi:hypothetical protein
MPISQWEGEFKIEEKRNLFLIFLNSDIQIAKKPLPPRPEHPL